MGASDSKLVFKKGIFRLSEGTEIPADDPYWTSFWELPESVNDVFTLFSAADIRRTRDNALPNLETLLLVVTSRLLMLRHHPSFPDPEIAPERDALNCIRILTRLLPFLYEADHLESWEDTFFWGARRRRTRKAALSKSEVLFDESKPEDDLPGSLVPGEDFEDVKPLAEELIDALIDLMFFADFTSPSPQTGKAKVTYSIWQSGVGCNNAVPTTKEFESNRGDIVRLLLTLTSKSMYMSASALPIKGVKAVTYISTCPDKQTNLSVLCSLLNTTIRYNPASWRVPYDHVVFKDPREVLVTYSLQLLLVILLYPIPESSSSQSARNQYRHFYGRLHRPQDFQFLVDGMTRILNQPVQANSSYLPGSQKAMRWTPEIIMLFWETLQCNKRFRSFIVDTDRMHDFMILVLFYAVEYKTDPAKQGVVRMCVFVLQTLSSEPKFGTGLNKAFESQESLPPNIRIKDFQGSYADHLIISIYTLITSSKGKLQAIYPALLAIINNIAAHLENISPSASARLLQLFVSMSSPAFLLANETNHTLLTALLESMNAIIEHQYSSNPNFAYAVYRARKRFEGLRSFTLESGQEEIDRQSRQRKEQSSDMGASGHGRGDSIDSVQSPSIQSPSASQQRHSTLSNVPEESSAFAIGDDDSDEEQEHQPNSPSSSPPAHGSRAPSVSSSVDEAVPSQRRGMSEKARGKMPVGTPTFSRQNSTTSLSSQTASMAGTGAGFAPSNQWIESWVPELPLHTILTLIQQLGPQIRRIDHSAEADSQAVMQTIQKMQIGGIEPSPIRVHLFEWTPMSLGWYESLLWGLIFTNEMYIAKGSVGTWNGTSIKLFKVQETAAEGPTLLAPRGAVDAVGSNLVQRIGNLNLRGPASPAQNEGPHRQSTS